MATRELLCAVHCDVCDRCFGQGTNNFSLWRQAEAAGWKFRRRKDGQIAGRGGKDYCPSCQPASWSDDATPVTAPSFTPEGGGSDA